MDLFALLFFYFIFIISREELFDDKKFISIIWCPMRVISDIIENCKSFIIGNTWICSTGKEFSNYIDMCIRHRIPKRGPSMAIAFIYITTILNVGSNGVQAS